MNRFTRCLLIVATSLLIHPSLPAQERVEPHYGPVVPESGLSKTVVFRGGEHGFALHRIPVLLVTERGTLLAFCESREAHGDWSNMDIALRRSEDGGLTWDKYRAVVNPPDDTPLNPAGVASVRRAGKNVDTKQLGVTANNACPISDRETGAVHLVHCVEYNRAYYVRSDDDGRTWSEPVDLTPVFEKFRSDYDWNVIATGPSGGVQLSNGRLVVPLWMADTPSGHRPSAVATIFSDDHGKTWQPGEIIATDNPQLKNPNESCLVQLVDGRVMIVMRNEQDRYRKAVSYSPDGASGWTQPVFHEQLIEPICMASVRRLTGEPRPRLLFSCPHSLQPRLGGWKLARRRMNLSVKLSYDEGVTWPVSKTIEAGPSGYSDLAVGHDGWIYLLYEDAGNDFTSDGHGESITFARFNLEWLTDQQDSLNAKGGTAASSEEP